MKLNGVVPRNCRYDLCLEKTPVKEEISVQTQKEESSLVVALPAESYISKWKHYALST